MFSIDRGLYKIQAILIKTMKINLAGIVIDCRAHVATAIMLWKIKIKPESEHHVQACEIIVTSPSQSSRAR